MFNFGIAGYEPRWTNSPRAAEAAHGHRLRALTGRPLTGQQPVDWPGFALRWHANALPEPRALLGLPLQDVELLTWSGDDAAHGSIEVGFVFPEGRIAVHNALDENGLSFDPPDPLSRPVTRRTAQ
ncbi:hypothetical protein AB0H77_06880 [Streptomyces sp. NPDC050844]|uniref:hypothetical protein n=1 Tax=Streptomyces sp. NPDC050844 TaxID=3155790 RepID=UPI0033E9BB2D